MREGMSGAGDFVHFKAHVPLHHIPVLFSQLLVFRSSGFLTMIT